MRILNGAVDDMLRYAFLARGRRLPREKAFLDELARLDPELGGLAQSYYLAPDAPARFALAERIAQCAIGVTGFFAWESTPEAVTVEPDA